MLQLLIRRGDKARADQASGFALCPDVKASFHPDGVVFLHIGRGRLLSSNRTGARIWQCAAEGKSLDCISAEVGREFQAPPELVKRDAARFLGELEAEGLLNRSRT